MKTRADLVRGWLLKAESNLANARLCLEAQQAAEKSIKAYLTAHDVDFPFIHNLEKLVELCAQLDPAFTSVKALSQELTPYAVELRYDDEFWPLPETARQAFEAALAIVDFVAERIPSEMKPRSV